MAEAVRLRLLEEVRAEATELEFPALDRTAARQIGEAIAGRSEREGLPVTVAVHLGEQLVYHAAFDGTTAENDGWVARKRQTVLRFDMSSFEVALTTRLAGRTPDWLDPTRLAVASGAVPLRVGGLLVGTVAVSGLVDAEESDHRLAMSGIASLG
ncbi:heme-binding protein [Microbacterium tumbae]